MNPTPSPGISLLQDSRWQAFASGQATARAAVNAETLEMDYDFAGGGGFAVARQELVLDLPAEFTLKLQLRAEGAANDVELKLVDETGRNVWRHTLRAAVITGAWQEILLPDYQLEFAWGPAGGGSIRRLSAVELAVVAGEGGTGTLQVNALDVRDATLQSAPGIACSTCTAPPAADLSGVTAWVPAPDDPAPWLDLTFPAPRMTGGLVVEWQGAAPAAGLSVSGKNLSGETVLLWQAPRMGGSRSCLHWPGQELTVLRLDLHSPAAIAALRWQPFAFSRSPEAFWHTVAELEPRGFFPRWLDRVQALWTPVGTPEGQPTALLNEDGLVEPLPGSFSVEPFLSFSGRFFSRADVTPQQSLQDGWLPLPRVTWPHEDWTLDVECTAAEPGSVSVQLSLTNLSDRTADAVLYAAIRPFQVTPPWQKFATLGGVSPVHSIGLEGGAVRVNDAVSLSAEDAPEFGAMTSAEGVLPALLAAGILPEQTAVNDPRGEASGVMAWRFQLPPGETRRVRWHCGKPAGPRETFIARWQAKLPGDRFTAAGAGLDVVQSAGAAAAHILLTRSGAALQPGPRRYTRSWIRDGTVMAAALLRMGCVAEVRDFIAWYAPHQRADGFVPSILDPGGPDWLVEHDSHGQFMSLVADYCRLTGDAVFAQRLWPQVQRAAAYVAATLEPDGLMPVSVSHEGYLAQPVHSFWDDFWTLRGLLDAAWLAEQFGSAEDSAALQETSRRLSAGLREAVTATRKRHGLAWIPASVEWADFDPVATAGAVILRDGLEELDAAALHATFDRFMTDWRRKRAGTLEWSNYTAYEVRIIGALVRLGRRADALELLHFLTADQRPAAWQQWPEITWRDPRWPGHIGDVPHTWIAAEFFLAVQSLFAWESADHHYIMLAAGISADWLRDGPVHLNALPVSTGTLSYTLQRLEDGTLEMQITATLSLPAGGLRVRPPVDGPIRAVMMNGEADTTFTADELHISALPATILISTLPDK